MQDSKQASKIASNPATGLWRKRNPWPTPTRGEFCGGHAERVRFRSQPSCNRVLARPGRWGRVLVTRVRWPDAGLRYTRPFAKASQGRPSLRCGRGGCKSRFLFAQYLLCKPNFAALFAISPSRRHEPGRQSGPQRPLPGPSRASGLSARQSPAPARGAVVRCYAEDAGQRPRQAHCEASAMCYNPARLTYKAPHHGDSCLDTSRPSKTLLH